MLRILHDTNYDFIRYWKHAAVGTIIFIVLGFAGLLYHRERTGVWLNKSIEFTGGTVVQVRFRQPPSVDDLRAAVSKAGFPNAEIQQFGSPTDFSVRAQPIGNVREDSLAATSDTTAAQIKAALVQRFGAENVKPLGSSFVGPRVGKELSRNAIIAVLISFIVTLVYLAVRFEWRFGVAAVIATAHDILTTIAFLTMMRLEISLTVVAAILTVIGYSLNDTIIIFDRVRENLKKQRSETFREVLNRSINETLPRSVLTHATTLAATLALLFFAGEVIRPFSWIMAFGIFTGTFSSVYVAGALLLWIERRWPRDTTHAKGVVKSRAEERKRDEARQVVAAR